MTGDISTRGARRALSPKAIELGRGFLSSLFMGLRTAQIHDSSNKAFDRAVQNVRAAAEGLYAATGGFSVSFVDDSAFLNGVRLRFDGSAYDAMVTLRHLLEQKDLGGIEMRSPPSYEAVRKLILMFSAQAEVVNKDDLLAMQIGVLGVQRFADKNEGKLNIDRRVFAVHCYAKLMLAFREHRAAFEDDRPPAKNAFPRLRAVRIVQDVVELSGDRLDFLLRLGANHRGAPADELHAANVCVLSVAAGRALGLSRADLVDLGAAALLHDIGRTRAEEPPPEAAADEPAFDAHEAEDDPAIDPLQIALPLPLDALRSEPAEGGELWFGDTTQKTAMRLAPGRPGHPEEMMSGDHPHAAVSYARLLAASGLGRAGLVRTLTAAEHHDAFEGRFAYSRIVATVDAYDALCSGLGTPDGAPLDPLDALAALADDGTGRIDPDVFDLLINVLRAFPRGTEVVLDSGEIGVVHTHEGGSRWDRPIVHVHRPNTRVADLMVRDGDRFVGRIRATVRYLGMMVEASRA